VFTAIGLIYFGVMTGGRVIRDGAYGAPIDQAIGTRIAHMDTHNTLRCEPRTQQAMPELRELRNEFAKAKKAAICIEGFDGVRYQELKEPLIFFLTQRVRPSLATSEWVRYVLRMHPDLAAAFPYALNVGRHALATMLAELILEPALRRYGLGHQRNHAETLGRFSMALIRHYETEIAEAISKWIQSNHLSVPRFCSEEMS